MNKKLLYFLGTIVGIGIIAAIIYIAIPEGSISPKLSAITIEIGTTIPTNINEYASGSAKALANTDLDISGVNINKVGNYPITITHKNELYCVQAEIIDTGKPVLNVNESGLHFRIGDRITVDDLSLAISDKSPYTVIFYDNENRENGEYEYIFNTLGNIERNILVTDTSGNETYGAIKYWVTDAHDPTFTGIADRTIYNNQQISMAEGVSALDEEDGDITDKMKVTEYNCTQLGEQTVTYSVTDASGNPASATAKLIVREYPFTDTSKTMYATSSTYVYSYFENGTVIGSLGYAEAIAITANGKNNGWVRVNYKGNEGYVYASALSNTKPEVTTAAAN